MRIALDVRPLQNESAGRGVGRYVRSLIANAPETGDAYLYLESLWSGPADLPPGARGARVRLLRPPRAITLFDQAATPLLCALRGIDVFHSTFYALPRLAPRRTRRVITVHDLIPVLLPGAASARNTAIFSAIYRSARVADAVIVPSRRTAGDLEARIGVARERIHVVPMGVGPQFSPGLPAGPGGSARTGDRTVESGAGGADRQAHGGLSALRAARPSGGRVLLYVGGFDPSKDVAFLFEALARIADGRIVLAVAGEPGRSRDALADAARRAGVAPRVVPLGRLSEAQLAEAYREADLFVSASRYEGFGLSPLEAMASGCPVVSVETGAVPEVLEGAAVVVGSRDAEAFAAAVVRVLADGELRAGLRTSGLARAAELSWERTARETAAVYKEVASADRGRAR